MQRKHASLLAAAAMLAVVGCETRDPAAPEVPAISASAQTSNIDVFRLASPTAIDPTAVVGQSHLTRNKNGLRGNVRTSGLTPGHVVTMWFTTFQNPSGCIGDCNDPAVDFAPGHGSTALGGATIVPASGKVTIAGKLDVGTRSSSAVLSAVPSSRCSTIPWGRRSTSSSGRTDRSSRSCSTSRWVRSREDAW